MFSQLLYWWDGGEVLPNVTICETGIFQLNGQTASFGLTGNVTTAMEPGVFVINGQIANFVGGVVPVVPSGRPKPQPVVFTVTVRKKKYTFTSIDALVAFLQDEERKAEQKAREKAKKDARRIIKLGPAKAKPYVPEFPIDSTTPEIKAYVDEVNKKVGEVYWQSVADVLGIEAEELEDIKYIASIL